MAAFGSRGFGQLAALGFWRRTGRRQQRRRRRSGASEAPFEDFGMLSRDTPYQLLGKD